MLAEEVAFRQATVITVVSQVIKDSLVARGVEPQKILVNPNGADPDSYAPPAPDDKRAVRQELGLRRQRTRDRFHGHVRRLARDRRAGRGDAGRSARRSRGAVPADRRRSLQAAGRQGGRGTPACAIA